MDNNNNNEELFSEHTIINRDDVIRCPKCGSTNIHFVTIQASQDFDVESACCGYFLCGPLGLLMGVKDKKERKTIRKCMSCLHEF